MIKQRTDSGIHTWIFSFDMNSRKVLLRTLADHADDDNSPMTWDHAERIVEMIMKTS